VLPRVRTGSTPGRRLSPGKTHGVAVSIVYETHSISEDNERGIATGWLGGKLSVAGREQARQLGDRRRDDGIDVIFTSDLSRAVETVEIAFAGTAIPVLVDWRLRECDYGDLNGMSAARLEATRLKHLYEPYPGGESWQAAVARVASFLRELRATRNGQRVLLVGHVATRWALDHVTTGKALAELAAAPFRWQEGWEYTLN
jgi:2,3-bisphosphoglycerate-dependent phosphoglycerate mutase